MLLPLAELGPFPSQYGLVLDPTWGFPLEIRFRIVLETLGSLRSAPLKCGGGWKNRFSKNEIVKSGWPESHPKQSRHDWTNCFEIC